MKDSSGSKNSVRGYERLEFLRIRVQRMLLVTIREIEIGENVRAGRRNQIVFDDGYRKVLSHSIEIHWPKIDGENPTHWTRLGRNEWCEASLLRQWIRIQ